MMFIKCQKELKEESAEQGPHPITIPKYDAYQISFRVYGGEVYKTDSSWKVVSTETTTTVILSMEKYSNWTPMDKSKVAALTNSLDSIQLGSLIFGTQIQEGELWNYTIGSNNYGDYFEIKMNTDGLEVVDSFNKSLIIK